MSFLNLPLDLFVDIFELLETNDQQCLRLTCRGLKARIQKRGVITLPPIRPPWSFEREERSESCHMVDAYYVKEQVFQQWNFANRLKRRPGDLLYWKDVDACAKCLKIRRGEDIASRREFKDGGSVCHPCLAELLGPRRIVSADDTTTGQEAKQTQCGSCNQMLDPSMIHHGCREDGHISGSSLCQACHQRVCWKVYCEGWPSGWVKANQDHFLKSICQKIGCQCEPILANRVLKIVLTHFLENEDSTDQAMLEDSGNSQTC